jgi:hypothetical protein
VRQEPDVNALDAIANDLEHHHDILLDRTETRGPRL